MFNVVILSIASMLAYISKEMVYPILPLYLSITLGFTPAFIGLIEGVTKSISSIVKFYSGYFSDKKQRRKIFVIIGFLGDFIHKLLLFLSTSWVWIIGAKTIEKLGKAVRTAPRDAIMAESITDNRKGKIFGIQRTFDKLGAVIGIVISFLLITMFTITDYKSIFLISTIPVGIGVILLFFLKQEGARGIVNIDFKKFNFSMKIFFIAVFISSLGNSTKAFLLLKASDSGFNAGNVILLYLLANLTTCLLAYPIGRFSDKISKKNIITMAYLVFGISYLGLAMSTNHMVVAVMFVLYGLFIALISVGGKAFIIENTPSQMKATALGINECLIGLASLPSSIIAGILWQVFSPSAAFYFSAFLALVALIVTRFIKRKEMTNHF